MLKTLIFEGIGEVPQQANAPVGSTGALRAKLERDPLYSKKRQIQNIDKFNRLLKNIGICDRLMQDGIFVPRNYYQA